MYVRTPLPFLLLSDPIGVGQQRPQFRHNHDIEQHPTCTVHQLPVFRVQEGHQHITHCSGRRRRMQQSHHKLPIHNTQYSREVYSRCTYMTPGDIVPLRSYTEGIDQPTICTYYIRIYVCILYTTVSVQQTNLLPDNASRMMTFLPRSLCRIYVSDHLTML